MTIGRIPLSERQTVSLIWFTAASTYGRKLSEVNNHEKTDN
jgi:hypothetical protein